MAASKAPKKQVYISADTGRYVTKPYAVKHPSTTIKMTVPVGTR